MIFDLHLHTKEYSSDSNVSMANILKTAVDMGISGVGITDHGSRGFLHDAVDLGKETGVRIIVGMEYSCPEGHLLVFGVPLLGMADLSLEEVLIRVKRSEGVVIAAHPFRWDTPRMPDALERCWEMFDGIEAFNGSATTEENLAAHQFATDHKMLMFGGSDAHIASRVGRFATEITASIRSEDDFISAIHKARTNKKLADTIFPVARKGNKFTAAFSNEKEYRDKFAPPPIASLREMMRKK